MFLRPQELSDVFTVGFATLRANIRTSLAIMILPALVMTVLVVVGVIIGVVTGVFDTLADSEIPPVGTLITMIVGWLILMLACVAATCAATGANVHVFGQSALGRRTTTREALRRGLRSAPALIGVGLIAFVAFMVPILLLVGAIVLAVANDSVAIGLMAVVVLVPLLLIAWVALMPRLSLASYVVVLERRGPLEALKRSWALTRGRFWRTFGTLLLIGVVASMASSVVSAPLQFVAPMLTDAGDDSNPSAGLAIALLVLCLALFVLSVLVQSLAQTFSTAAIGAVYADARIRDESLDRQMINATGAVCATPPDAPIVLTPGELEFPRPR